MLSYKTLIFRNILFTTALMMAAGCTTLTHNSPVPGTAGNENELLSIKKSTVLAALKCQLVNAFIMIKNLKEDTYASHPSVNKYQIKSGVGTLSANGQTVETKGGTLKTVIPFSGYDGSNLTPDLGSERSGTGIYNSKITFNIGKDAKEEDRNLCKGLKDNNIIVGYFVEDAVVAGFNDIMEVPLNSDNKPYGPVMTGSTIEITTSFSVVQDNPNSATVKFVPTGDIKDIQSILSRKLNQTDALELTVKLETLVGKTDDTRRIIWDTGNGLFIEEPYTDDRLDELKKMAGGQIKVDDSDSSVQLQQKGPTF